jgi:hypothetical protein
MAEDKDRQTINFADRNAVEKFLVQKKKWWEGRLTLDIDWVCRGQYPAHADMFKLSRTVQFEFTRRQGGRTFCLFVDSRSG